MPGCLRQYPGRRPWRVSAHEARYDDRTKRTLTSARLVCSCVVHFPPSPVHYGPPPLLAYRCGAAAVLRCAAAGHAPVCRHAHERRKQSRRVLRRYQFPIWIFRTASCLRRQSGVGFCARMIVGVASLVVLRGGWENEEKVLPRVKLPGSTKHEEIEMVGHTSWSTP